MSLKSVGLQLGTVVAAGDSGWSIAGQAGGVIAACLAVGGFVLARQQFKLAEEQNRRLIGQQAADAQRTARAEGEREARDALMPEINRLTDVLAETRGERDRLQNMLDRTLKAGGRND